MQIPTALIRINHNNKSMLFRALLDQGSTADLISKKGCEALGLPQWDVDIPITGVGGKETLRVKKRTQFSVSPFYTNSVSVNIGAFIMPSITTLPINPPDLNKWNHLRNLRLADPKMDRNGRIDILIGNGTLSEILSTNVGIIKGKNGEPIAQKTSLGWVISGKTSINTSSSHSVWHLNMSDQPLSSALKLFWESEEIPRANKFTPLHLAEDIFKKTTKRCEDGKFMVKLPLNPTRLKVLATR